MCGTDVERYDGTMDRPLRRCQHEEVDAVSLLVNRIRATNATIHTLAGALDGVDLVKPVAFGTSPLGLTLWHLPRTQDWLVNTSIRGVPEVADDFYSATLPDPWRYGIGTGLTPEQAQEAAADVGVAAVLAYADAVTHEILNWLSQLGDDDLDLVPDFAARQQTRPAYCTPGALAEVQGLPGLPVGVLLLRPPISHFFVHAGEIEILTQLALREPQRPLGSR